jgi:hypothetical protein
VEVCQFLLERAGGREAVPADEMLRNVTNALNAAVKAVLGGKPVKAQEQQEEEDEAFAAFAMFQEWEEEEEEEEEVVTEGGVAVLRREEHVTVQVAMGA